MEYRLGRIELPPADYAQGYAQGYADGLSRADFHPNRRTLRRPALDARKPEVLVAEVDRLARTNPEYVAYDNAPPGYGPVGPGHYRQVGL